MTDFPFHQVLAKAEKLAASGYQVFQKFSCQHCGKRLTIGTPNEFFSKGKCEQCGGETNIERTGCNYMVTVSRQRGTA